MDDVSCNVGEQAGFSTDTGNVLCDDKESCLVLLPVQPEIETPVTSSGLMPYLAALNTNFSSSKHNKIMTALLADTVGLPVFNCMAKLASVKADSHITCRSHAASVPFPCHAVPLRV